MSTLPADFIAEAEQAVAETDRAHLILLSLELEGLGWEAAGKSFLANRLAELQSQTYSDRVILFTGHRIDSPGRTTPRFPAEAEPVAREAIRQLLMRQKQLGEVTGIAGGANGGDILFLELCCQLATPCEMLLIFPEDQFIEASVSAPGNWVQRFKSLATKTRPHVLSDSSDLPQWLAAKPDYSIWARNNLWMVSTALALSPRHFVLAALWNGAVGDGPGGTEHMVQLARQHGAQFIHLDTRELFSRFAIRTAEP